MRRLAIVVSVLSAALMAAGCGQVDQGERAVFMRWGVMSPVCYGQGLYWYEPFGTNMDLINVQAQAFKMEKMSAATKDLQEVHADVVVNYSLDGANCHKMFDQGQAGHSYKERVLGPALLDALKAGTAHFPIGQIIQERSQLRAEVTKALQERVAPYYIHVPDNGVSLTNFSVSDAYMKSVEAKQIEEQKSLQKAFQVVQAQRDAEMNAAKAKGEADATRERAKGEADALRLKGLAQAEYNAKVSASLTPILVQQQTVDAWRAGGSHVPHVQTGAGGGGIFVQLPAAAPVPAK